MTQLQQRDGADPATVSPYRSDINGLRAVAVLAVVAFHANLSTFEGGYVGVDVFFVISGFLISRIIFEQVDAGRFDLVRFYTKRFQRIVPALFVMILLTGATGLWLLYPTELIDLSKSALASILSLSNILFWSTTDYFDTPAAAKPLLHTWSLGVEEQFYLLFPLLVVALHRLRRDYRVPVLGALTLVSFALSAYLAATDAASAFYLPQSRIWEFLVGALLSCGAAPPLRNRAVREAIALAGLAAIGGSVLAFGSLTPFPGFAALVPCLGAAAVIYAGSAGQTLVGRVLALPPVAAVGTISYSLYLYHWPLIVFQRLDGFINVAPSQALNRGLLLLLIFGLAFLSWRFVEVPFRTRRARPRSSVLPLFAPPVAVIAGLSLFVMVSNGLPWRFSGEAIRLASFLKYDPNPEMRKGSCFLDNRLSFASFNKVECLGRVGDRPTMLLLGDSHAGHLYPGFKEVYGSHANILEATATGCKPLLRDAHNSSACGELINYIYNTYLVDHRVDYLVISAKWAPDDIAFVAPTLDRLQRAGIRTILVGPTPEYDVQLPGLLARSDLADRARIASHLDPEFARLDRQLQSIAANRPGITYYSPYQQLCDATSCAFLAGNDPLFYDKSHLTRSGSRMVAEQMRGVFAPL